MRQYYRPARERKVESGTPENVRENPEDQDEESKELPSQKKVTFDDRVTLNPNDMQNTKHEELKIDTSRSKQQFKGSQDGMNQDSQEDNVK